MRAFVDDAGSRLEKPRHDRGAQPPKLPDRSRFLNRLAADHPLRANHEAAFAAMTELRRLGWRPMSAGERKRKQRADRDFAAMQILSDTIACGPGVRNTVVS